MSVDHSVAFALIRKFEGVIPWLYVDTVGHVTVGCGNVVNAESVRALPFVVKGTTERASGAQIADDYDRVSKAPKGQRARFYETLTTCRLPPVECERLFSRRIVEFTGQLRKLYPEYDAFPQSAQLALLDMIFQCGAGSLKRNWPNFSAAVHRKAWRKCAVLCHRKASSDVRNNTIADLFREAGAIPTV